MMKREGWIRLQCIKIIANNRLEAEIFVQEISTIVITDEDLLKFGYLIKQAGKTVGFFILQPIETNQVWLRKFVISQVKDPTIILAMIELAVKEAKTLEVDGLIVMADRPTLEQLLTQLGFVQVAKPVIKTDKQSTCWEYLVHN